MSDIIDELDRLQDTIEGFPNRSTIRELAGALERRIEIVNEHWPAISARLREAERERDEWKLASSKNGDAMSGYQSRAIVAEQRLVEAERKAAAWDVIADGHIHREDDGLTFSGFVGKDSSWGRTIEAAIAAKETKQ